MKKNRSVYQMFSVSIFILSILLFFSCSKEIIKRTYKFTSQFSGSIKELPVSKNKIERNKTYEFYFKPIKPVKCIEISMKGEYYPSKFSQKKVKTEIYFILEKKFDISKFNIKNGFIYNRIGQNFTESWNQHRSIEICPGDDNITLSIDNKSVFRIRFTSFIPEDFTYHITFKANSKIFQNLQKSTKK